MVVKVWFFFLFLCINCGKIERYMVKIVKKFIELIGYILLMELFGYSCKYGF